MLCIDMHVILRKQSAETKNEPADSAHTQHLSACITQSCAFHPLAYVPSQLYTLPVLLKILVNNGCNETCHLCNGYFMEHELQPKLQQKVTKNMISHFVWRQNYQNTEICKVLCSCCKGFTGSKKSVQVAL